MKLFHLAFVLFFSVLVQAQNSYDKAVSFNEKQEYERAKYYFLKTIEEGKLQDSLIVGAYWNVGDIYSNVSVYDSSDFYYQKGLELARQSKDSLWMAEIYLSLNYQHHYQEDLQPALEFVMKAEPIFEKYGKKDRQAEALMRIGTMNIDMERDSIAFDYFDQAFEILKEVDAPHVLAITHQSAAFAHGIIHGETFDPKEFELAMFHYEKAMDLFKAVGNNLPLANCLNGISSMYRDLEEYDNALPYQLESMEIAREEGSGIGMTWNYYGIADIYLSNDDFQNARIYADSALATAEKYNIQDGQSSSLGLIAEILYRQENYKEAIDYIEFQQNIEDSIYSKQNYQQMNALQAEFESVKKDKTLAELNHEKELDEIKKKGLYLALILVALMSILIINREVKRRRKAAELLMSEQRLRETEEEKLKEEIEFKNRELTSMALQIAQKNEMMNSLKKELSEISSQGEGNGKIRALQNKLRIEGQMESFWDQFTRQFNETHSSFFQKLTTPYPDLTKNELRLASLIRMNLSTKEMASILNVTEEGIKKARYRMKKKLNLKGEEGIEQHLLKF